MTVRYISIHKSTKSMEAGAPPSPELMAAMGPLMSEMMKAGIFISGEGLRPSSQGVRLVFSGGKRTITKGPFAGSNEQTAAFAIVRLKSIEEAIEWATRFASVVSDSEIDIRPVTEMWDLGFGPNPPQGTPVRYMIIRKADKGTESGVPPAIGKVTDEMSRAGVLVTAEGLKPSATGIRLKFAGGKHRVIDGPFTESKELIAGYSITQLKSIDQAVEWAVRFATLADVEEIDIRPLYEPADLR